jgi:hypothetical protein
MQKLAAGFLGTTLLAGLSAIYFWQQLQSERTWNAAAPYLVRPGDQWPQAVATTTPLTGKCGPSSPPEHSR